MDTINLREILDSQLRCEQLLLRLVQKLDAPPKPRKAKTPMTKEDERAIKKMLLEGRSQFGIAKITGRSSSIVNGLAKELEKQRRNLR
jgi:hypothetical protein